MFFSSSAQAVTEVDVEVMTGQRDLEDVSIAEQKHIHEWLTDSSPYGKTLTSYFIPKDSPALAFLRPEMRAMLYRWNTSASESNCYWTSLFATRVLEKPERFVDWDEYIGLIQRRFNSVPNTGEYQPGDIIRLKRQRGQMELHSVVYIGRARGTPSTEIVLSKNGPKDGPYLVMTLWELMLRVYPSAFSAGV